MDATSPAGRRPSWRAWPPRPAAPTLVHVASLVVGLGWLLVVGGEQWFVGDEWAFLTERRDPGTLWLAHQGHWSTIPHLVFQGLYALVGIRDYTPYLLLNLLVHVGIVHLVWRVARRAGADAWVATAGALVLLVLGAGGENVWWAFQIGLGGSVLAGLAAAWLLASDAPVDWRRDAGIAALLCVALLLSGVTVAVVVGVGVAALLRDGWARAARVTAPPAVVFTVWATTTWLPSLPADREAGRLSLDSLAFAGRVLANAPASVVRAPLVVGALLLAAAGGVAAVGVARGRRRQVAAPVGLATAAVVFAVMSGATRVGLGPGAALAGRYVHVVVALLAPLAIVALSRAVAAVGASSVRPVVRGVLVAGLLVVAGTQARLLVAEADAQAAHEQQVRREVAAAVDVLGTGAPVGDTAVLAGEAYGLSTDVLRAFLDEGAVALDDVTPRAEDVVSARAALLVHPLDPSAGAATDGDGPAPRVVAGIAAGPVDGDGCTAIGGEEGGVAVVEVAAPSVVDVDTTAPFELGLVVQEAGVPAHRVRRIPLDEGRTPLRLGLADARIDVMAPPGVVLDLCGVVDDREG